MMLKLKDYRHLIIRRRNEKRVEVYLIVFNRKDHLPQEVTLLTIILRERHMPNQRMDQIMVGTSREVIRLRQGIMNYLDGFRLLSRGKRRKLLTVVYWD